MTFVVLLVVTGLVMSLVGSFVPVFAAEVYVVGVALAQSTAVTLVVVVAVVAGQTLGKVAVLASARPGGGWGWVRSVRQGAHRHLDRVRRAPRASRVGAWVAPAHRWTVDAMGRPHAPYVVALSGAVGLPPLLAVTVYAARSTMRTRWFVVACAAGRGARMLTLALVPALGLTL